MVKTLHGVLTTAGVKKLTARNLTRTAYIFQGMEA